MQRLSYVVLRHDGFGDPHYDLMFETAANSKLATWRSSQWPLQHGTILTRIGDHRREYLTYEGPLSRNRGTVARIQTGTFELMANDTGRFEAAVGGKRIVLSCRADDEWLCEFFE